MKQLITVSMVLSLIAIGCVDDRTPNDELKLLEALNNDEFAGIDGLGVDSPEDLDHEFGLESYGAGRTFTDTLAFGNGYKIRFGREILDRNRDVEFEIDEDTAIGFITYSLTGNFHIKVFDTSTYEQIDSLSFVKEFSTSLFRKVRFTQHETDANPDGYFWKVDAFTPMVGGSGDKVDINGIFIYSLTDDYEQGDLLHQFLGDDILDVFIQRESIPTFTAFVPYMVTVSVTNAGPELSMDSTGVGEWVFKNYGYHRNHRGRKALNDKGVFFDETANDNLHSGAWRSHGPGHGLDRRAFRSFFETVDLATLFVNDGEYNTAIWSIPYRVERP